MTEIHALGDLAWLDDAVGGARVVAIGESAHYNQEVYELRDRLLRRLVERHGFTAYAMESGFVEGRRVDAWVRGGDEPLGRVQAEGMTSLMGLWTPMRGTLEWLREHNRTAARPAGFYGIDLPGSVVSLLPGLDAVLAYLAEAEPGFAPEPDVRALAAENPATSAFSAPAAMAAAAENAPDRRDALTAGLAGLAARMDALRLDYEARTSPGTYARARHAMRLTVALDALHRAMLGGDMRQAMSARDAEMAATVEWILDREDRVVLAAHNGHIQRSPGRIADRPEMTPLGRHLADRLGPAYLPIGTTTGTGQVINTAADFYDGVLFTTLDAPAPGTLDAEMAARHPGPYALDLRTLSPGDPLRTVTAQRGGDGTSPTHLDPAEAFDILIHLPHVTAAEPDPDAVACSPADVREAFGRWTARAR